MIPGSHHHNVTGPPTVLTASSLATWATAVSSGGQSQQASSGMEVEEVDDRPQPPLSVSAVACLLAKDNECLIDLLSERLERSK
jgi:hypothetical protein